MITSFTEALIYMENALAGSVALLVSAITLGIAGYFWGKGVPVGSVFSTLFGVFLISTLYGIIGETPTFVYGIQGFMILLAFASAIFEILKGGRR